MIVKIRKSAAAAVCVNIKVSEDNVYSLSLLNGFEGFENPDLIDTFIHS